MFYSNYITHTIIVSNYGCSSHFDSHLKSISIIQHILPYQLCDSMDVDLEEIRTHKNELVNFIEGAKLAGESVLIYYPIKT